MARVLLFVTADQADDRAVEALAAREQELASYDANIASYEAQISSLDAALPSEWPVELAKFTGRSPEQIYALASDGDNVDLAAKLAHRDRLRMLLYTERTELGKSELAYDVCVGNMPKDEARRSAAMARHAAKQAAKAE